MNEWGNLEKYGEERNFNAQTMGKSGESADRRNEKASATHSWKAHKMKIIFFMNFTLIWRREKKAKFYDDHKKSEERIFEHCDERKRKSCELKMKENFLFIYFIFPHTSFEYDIMLCCRVYTEKKRWIQNRLADTARMKKCGSEASIEAAGFSCSASNQINLFISSL